MIDNDDMKAIWEEMRDKGDARWRSIEDCEDITDEIGKKIENHDEEIKQIQLDNAKTNTKLSILIAISSAIAVELLPICIQKLFGG